MLKDLDNEGLEVEAMLLLVVVKAVVAEVEVVASVGLTLLVSFPLPLRCSLVVAVEEAAAALAAAEKVMATTVQKVLMLSTLTPALELPTVVLHAPLVVDV